MAVAAMMNRAVLHDPFSDLTPIAAPFPRARKLGEAISFESVVADAGVRNVVTGRIPPIFIHDEADDFYVPAPGARTYCLAVRNLPAARQARACEILRRMAYGFHEYASREVVGRARRDIVRGSLDLSHVVYSPRDPRKE